MAKKILVVDDELESVKLVGLMLQRHGYEVTAAQSGSQALAKALSDDPDLMILDVMMPDMDGYEVCRRLRANPVTADLPVIMFTAKTQVDEKVAGFQAGADDYLTKPIHPDELTSHVEAVLLRSARRRTDEQPQVRAEIIGFLGSKGGVGSTTLVVNVAVALSRGSAKKVLLADMRSGLSTASMQLGLRRSGGLARLLELPVGSIDIKAVEARLDEHSTGVLVLSGQIEPPGVAEPVSPTHADVIVRHLGALADYVLLDLGVGLDEANRRVLQRCNQVVVPVEPQRVSITLTQTLLDEMIQSLKIARHRIRVVSVNKAPIVASFTKEAIEGMLQHDLAGVITPAPDLAFQAAERGIPMVMIQPDSVVALQIQALATHLAEA